MIVAARICHDDENENRKRFMLHLQRMLSRQLHNFFLLVQIYSVSHDK